MYSQPKKLTEYRVAKPAEECASCKRSFSSEVGVTKSESSDDEWTDEASELLDEEVASVLANVIQNANSVYWGTSYSIFEDLPGSSSSNTVYTHLGMWAGAAPAGIEPDTFEYAVIEVNPRVSRSSALASKATGYPHRQDHHSRSPWPPWTRSKRHHRQDLRLLRAHPGLHRGEMPNGPFDKFADASRKLGTDEGHRRGDGHCPQL